MSVWREAALGEEIELAYGKALPATSREAGPVIVYGSNGPVGTHTDLLVDGPGIIVGRKGSVGAVVYSTSDFWPIDTTYYVVNRGNHNMRFLFHLLRSIGLTGLNSHSAVPGLNREDVYSIRVAIPPRDVQDDIARVLDVVADSRNVEVDALRATEELRRAVAGVVFAEPAGSDDAADAPNWVREPLGASHKVSSGGTPSRAVPEYWANGSIPWVKTTEIDYSVIEATSEQINERALAESAAKILPVGTVLLAMYGQGVTRGRVALLGIEAATNQACAAIQSTNGAVNNRYLYHFLAHHYEALRQMAHGGQQQNLNLDLVRGFPISYPSELQTQERIVGTMDALDRVAQLHEKRARALESLLRGLSEGLVSGRLDLAALDLSGLVNHIDRKERVAA